MQFLFVKEKMSWPRSSGHDVHGYHIMRALSESGHDVSLATLHEPDANALDGAGLVGSYRISNDPCASELVSLTRSQERFRNYWGIPETRIHQVGRLSRELQADVVVVIGLNVLPYLGAVRNACRIWYAGDEWVWHHLSQFSLFSRSTWGELKQALVKGLYERAYRSLVDRVWMVSESDRRAYEWVTGSRNVDVLPNGIDSEYYAPINAATTPRSCIFWGRLDFGPNIQALQWFCRNVWPRIRRVTPDARFTICGFQPTREVQSLISDSQGIALLPNLPDIRSQIAAHEIVVLPFVSGGGIKNKLLEAAAMGKPIVCTPRTVKGLSAKDAVVRASSSRQWVRELCNLWASAERRQSLGAVAHRWVVEEHTWESAAAKAIQGLRGVASLTSRGV